MTAERFGRVEVIDLAALTPAAQDRWGQAYGIGYEHGVCEGRRQVEAEVAAEWRALGDLCRSLAAGEPFDVLADRRGDHERARRQRAILSGRGVA